jgi:uncharacterized membrane protein YphA (DoxX/SURF4 family)
MSIIRVTARALVGAAALADGVGALRDPGPHEAVAAPAVAKLAAACGRDIEARQVVRATALSQTIGGGLIASSIAPRLGALATLVATVPATLVGHRFWEIDDDSVRRAALRTGFFAHLTLAGAALLVLAGPTRTKRRGKAAAAREA